jgi:glucosamine-phosphate N-acetyltransferase
MIREIEKNDFYKGYMSLVNIFTKTPIVKTYDEFCKILDIVSLQNSKIFVIEEDGIIVSTLKIIIEQKLHNNFACVGHIEDVVTHPDYRGKGYASKLIEYAKKICSENNCYKIVLCSNDNNISYYEKCGFIQKGKEMTTYFYSL